MEIIDLHGVKHREVYTRLSKHCINYDGNFIIITGNSNQMKKIVKAVINSFGLKTRESINNPGRIIVYE